MNNIITGNEKWPIKVECDVCKTVFDVKESELKRYTKRQDYEIRTIECPHCARQVWVRKNK